MLPEQGEVTKLDRAARAKIAALDRLLRAVRRDGVFDIKIIDHPQAVVGLYARAVVLISEQALELVSADELQALVAHEIGHEYVWAAYERAVASKDRSQIRQLELMCDGVAIVTLRQLGIDHSRLTAAVEKIAGFNRLHFGVAVQRERLPDDGRAPGVRACRLRVGGGHWQQRTMIHGVGRRKSFGRRR